MFDINPVRGAQFYPNCVQLEVTGDGAVELPKGVSFPGAYKFSDPGIHHDVSSLSSSVRERADWFVRFIARPKPRHSRSPAHQPTRFLAQLSGRARGQRRPRSSSALCRVRTRQPRGAGGFPSRWSRRRRLWEDRRRLLARRHTRRRGQRTMPHQHRLLDFGCAGGRYSRMRLPRVKLRSKPSAEGKERDTRWAGDAAAESTAARSYLSNNTKSRYLTNLLPFRPAPPVQLAMHFISPSYSTSPELCVKAQRILI